MPASAKALAGFLFGARLLACDRHSSAPCRSYQRFVEGGQFCASLQRCVQSHGIGHPELVGASHSGKRCGVCGFNCHDPHSDAVESGEGGILAIGSRGVHECLSDSKYTARKSFREAPLEQNEGGAVMGVRVVEEGDQNICVENNHSGHSLSRALRASRG